MKINDAYAKIGFALSQFGMIELLLNNIISKHYSPEKDDFTKYILNRRGVDIETKFRMVNDILEEHYLMDYEIFKPIKKKLKILIEKRNIIAHSSLYLQHDEDNFLMLGEKIPGNPMINTTNLVFFANKAEKPRFTEVMEEFNSNLTLVKQALWTTSFGKNIPEEK